MAYTTVSYVSVWLWFEWVLKRVTWTGGEGGREGGREGRHELGYLAQRTGREGRT